MLSIIVPVRNESNIIHEVFDYFFINLKNIKYEVLIVNDYSSDDTFDKCKSQLDQKNLPIDVYQLVLKEVEPPLLNAVMEFSNHNQSKAAKILGINRTTLRTKLKKYKISG